MEQNTIKISLSGSAIRTEEWMNCYNSLLSNKLGWEIVFVGDKRPDFVLPPNLKYIYSSTKPSQCYQIAFNNASGKLISWFADDSTFPPNALDDMYSFWKSFNNEKLITAFRTIEDGRDITEVHRFRGRDMTAPRMAPFGVMSRKLFNELGGYDRRFVCGQSENDVVMRVYEIGGSLEVSNIPIFVHHEKAHKRSGTVFRQGYYFADRKVLEECWVVNGVIQSKRLRLVEPFEEKDILTVTQSTKGQWK